MSQQASAEAYGVVPATKSADVLKIRIPTTSIETNVISGDSTAAKTSKKSTYVAYHIHVQTPKGERVVLRRMHEFHEFHKIWSSLYEGLKEQFPLPSSYAIIRTAGVIEKRRQGLETYLQGLNEVKAMRPLLAQFLGLEESEMYGESKVQRAPDAQTLAKMGQSGITNTALSEEEIKALNSRRGRGLSNPDIIQGLDVEDKAPLPAMYAIQDRSNTYIVPGQSIIATSDVADESKVVVATSVSKGNTYEANEQARRAKEEFLRQHSGVIASLMPGRQVNVMFNKGKVSETAQRSLGRIQVSIWYREGTGGHRRPLPPETLEPGQQWIDTGGGTILIDIHRGMDLASTDGITNPYVKLYLVPDPKKVTKKKTKVKSRTINPTWEESFEYPDIYPVELQFRHLSISVWDDRLAGKNTCIGEVILSDLSYLPRTAADRLCQWFELRPWSGITTVASTASPSVSGSSRSSPQLSPTSRTSTEGSAPSADAYALAAAAGAAANTVPVLATAPPVMPTAAPPRLMKGTPTPQAKVPEKQDEGLLQGLKRNVLSNFTGGGVLVPNVPLPTTPGQSKSGSEAEVKKPEPVSTPNPEPAIVKADTQTTATSSAVVRQQPTEIHVQSAGISESSPTPETSASAESGNVASRWLSKIASAFIGGSEPESASPATTTTTTTAAESAAATTTPGRSGPPPLPAPAPAVPQAEALYDYSPSEQERTASTVLPLKCGEIITLLDTSNEEWWYGQLKTGEVGYFPKAYVRKLD